jgi:hypothetical protein
VLSDPKLSKIIKLNDFGSHVVKFGLLTGDGSTSAVFAQIDKSRIITCLTAVSLTSGEILWQQGTPKKSNFRTTGEIPIQVYDWNQDGFDDVIYHQADQLIVLNGNDGSVQLNVPKARPYSLFIHKTNLFDGRAGLILVGRSDVELLNPELSTVWIRPNIDQDGEDEILAGYQLLRAADGGLVWDRADLKIHNDAADYGDVNCDGSTEVAIATSNRAAVVSASGETLWQGDEYHAQHITTGHFLPDTCERQVVTIDRDEAKSGIMRFYSASGKLLWQVKDIGNRAMLSRVDSWIPEIRESLILVFRSFNGPPRLYDARGRTVAVFPFPPAMTGKTGNDSHTRHYIQHFDMDNDGREEMVLYNESQLWIYKNNAPTSTNQNATPKTSQTLPNPRIFNSTFYQGMQ